MKVKIKGLVFVGFAAAVFAQSAMAATDAEKKIVTSKYYVDTTFQTLGNIVTTTEAATASNWDSDTTYPSMLVLKGVKDSLDAVGVIDDGAGYVDVQPGTGANAGKYIVGLDKTPVTGNTGITGTFSDGDGNKLVTAMGVKSLIDTTAISSSSDATHLPTSQAVYNYAQPKVSTANALQVGYYTGSGDAAWKTLQADDTASVTHYVSIAQKTGDANTYNVNLDNSTIASATTDFVASGDTNAATNRPKLATAGAVYDFVKAENAAYQPKVATASTANAVSIGYNSDGSTPTWGTLGGTGYVTISGSGGVYTANIDSNQIAISSDYVTTNTDLATAGGVYDFVNGNYQAKATSGAQTIEVGHDGAWANLVGDSTYTSVAMDNGSAKVSLTNLTNATTDFVASGDTNATANRPKLAKAGDVYDFVTNRMGGLTIPSMPGECNTAANNGGYCALVYGNKAAEGQTPDYGLQWTVMAPEPTPVTPAP